MAVLISARLWRPLTEWEPFIDAWEKKKKATEQRRWINHSIMMSLGE